jgi:carbamate kinase
VIVAAQHTAVVAVGGNSLIRAGEKGTIAEQRANARRTSEAIVALIRDGYDLVVTHGNGPQVGAALLRAERSADQVYALPLDVCGAATQGEIGYILQQALREQLSRAGIDKPVVTLLTQVVVSRADPAMAHPTKPIGPFYTQREAEARRERLGWTIVEDAARGWRRVVPSPEPLEIVEESVIASLVRGGALVIAAGGGGIPVVRENGHVAGIEAVIDKDRASALLAARLRVDDLIISTDVDCVYVDYKKPGQRALSRVRAPELRDLYERGEFPAGSMGPKIQSALRFLEQGGRHAIITDPERLIDAVHGRAGTHILPPTDDAEHAACVGAAAEPRVSWPAAAAGQRRR